MSISFTVSNDVPGFSLNHRLQMARTYHKSRMESISLFSTSTALEGLELFNPLPDPLDGESDFLHEYNDDVYSCIEERKAQLSNLLAEDLLQELNFEGLYYFLVLGQCIFNRRVFILRSHLLSRVLFCALRGM